MPHPNQLAKYLHREISAFIAHEEFGPASFVTLKEVVVSPDRSHAEVLVTVFPEKESQAVERHLTQLRVSLRRVLKRHLSIAEIPAISFTAVASEARASRIDALLAELKKEAGAPHSNERSQ